MTAAPQSEHRIPVIVGVGEIVDRPKEITEGLEPLTLLEEALGRAEQDSGGQLLGDIGSLDVVNFLSWRYRDPEQQLAKRLGVKPSHLYYGPVGGESPAICMKRQSASRAANALSPRSAAQKRSRPGPRPSAPVSPRHGPRSPMTWKSRSAAPRSRSRLP
jgi:hypothetical protein